MGEAGETRRKTLERAVSRAEADVEGGGGGALVNYICHWRPRGSQDRCSQLLFLNPKKNLEFSSIIAATVTFLCTL